MFKLDMSLRHELTEVMQKSIKVIKAAFEFLKEKFGHDKQEDGDLGVALSVLSNVKKEMDSFDCEFVQITTENDSELNESERSNLCKKYIILYRCLETLRILFIYCGSEFGIAKEIFKTQDLIEGRLKVLDKSAVLSVLRHNEVYGADKFDILSSPLIKRYSSAN